MPKDANNIYIERTANYGLHILLVNDLDITDVSTKKNEFRNNCMLYYNKGVSGPNRYY